VRAIKVHSGKFKAVVGRPLGEEILTENIEAVENGAVNLERQIKNVRSFGLPCVVAINRFKSDTQKETSLVKEKALKAGAFDCVVSELYQRGSKGGAALADAVEAASKARSKFRFLYPLNISIRQKIERIAKEIYGAGLVRFEDAASEKIDIFEKLGYGRLPVCMAKTHLSLSHDPRLLGRPEGFTLPVKDIRPSIGAGFLYALCGNTMTMPALPSHPNGERIDIDLKGNRS
jgi:formyltetrahydrofolate synthetase